MRYRSLSRLPAALALALGAACAAPHAPAAGARLGLSVAALDLPGVLDVAYRVTVTNGAGQPVWTRDLAASRYGDASGDLSYVGPCDADANDNTVTVELLGLYAATNLASPLPAASWHNPGPQSRAFTCLPNADVAVDFDLTIARAATQGFFDVAVSFDDVFCSAKLDCGASTAPADDLDLLHAPGGARGPTVVFGLACTADPTTGAETHLYLDPLTVTCGATPNYVVIDPTPLGNLDLGAPPQVNTNGYLFAAAVYRGVESLANKVYWNVALGLDPAHLPAAPCTLHARATAASTALAGQTTPAQTTWPLIAWDVLLTTAGARACTNTALDGGGGVATTYTSLAAPVAFSFHVSGSSPEVTVVDTCGDGVRGATEGCDDANLAPGDGCSPTCAVEPCGNGTLDSGEACDDGNLTSGDGCSATCTSEAPDPCGDGTREAPEACDDGNTVAGDGCSPTCALEDDPASLSGLWLWVKADAGVTLTSGAVSQWVDQSGHGRHFAQSQASKRPTVVAAANNGYPAIRLTATARQTLDMSTTLPNDHTVFIAARLWGTNKARILNAMSNNWLLGWWGGNQDAIYHMGWISPSSTFAASNDWLQYTDVNGSTTYAAYRSGRLMYTTGNVAVPQGLTLSGYQDGEYSDADILEILVYDRALSTAERQAVERYLASRYRFDDTAQLPSRLAGISQWLRADLGVTTVDDAGTARVSTWANQAGSSPNFTNTGALSTKPVVTPGALNGHPVLTLTASQSLGCASLVHSNALTAIVVARYHGASNRLRILSGKSSNWLIGWHGGYERRAYANAWISQATTAGTTDWQIYSLGHGTTSATLFRNGVVVAGEVAGTYTGPSGWTLNADYAGEPSDSQVAEIILVSRWITGWEVRELERYLNARYAIY